MIVKNQMIHKIDIKKEKNLKKKHFILYIYICIQGVRNLMYISYPIAYFLYSFQVENALCTCTQTE